MRPFVCPEAKEGKEMARRKGRSDGPKEGIRRSGLGPPAAFERRQLQDSRRRGAFSPAVCSITTTLESLMFDTWASYESTRAFVTSSFLLATLGPARRAGVCVASFRSRDHRTSARRTEGPSTHTTPSPPDEQAQSAGARSRNSSLKNNLR